MDFSKNMKINVSLKEFFKKGAVEGILSNVLSLEEK